jgi:hypothetical protein
MNLSTLRQFYAQLAPGTKTILIALLAFGLGTFFGGSGAANGRYLPVGGSGTMIIDTRTGTTWTTDTSRPGTYRRLNSFSYF